MSRLVSGLLELPADAEAFYDAAYGLGLTDGLPVVPPTDERVQRFIAASGLPASKEVAVIPPLQGTATVEKIAINSVMAGCRPEYMPVIVAAIEAMSDPAFNLLGVQTTTNPVGPMIVLNGPIRQQLEVNCGRGALGPGRRANATIGRAVRLVLLNVGGAVPGDVDKATLGMPGKYTMCLGELEEQSPWEPLHVERGLRAQDSAVTVIGVQGTDNMFVGWKKADSILRAMASTMTSLGANNTLRGQGNPILFMNPGHARLMADQGYDKKRIRQELYQRSKIPVSALPDEVSEIEEGSRHIVEGFNTVTRSPDDILIAVAGGPEAYHMAYCATFGEMAVTRRINVP